jgi:hypothetical protein
MGCENNTTLCTLFAWVALAVASLPIADMGQRLTPVYKALKQGILKTQKVPGSITQQRLAKSKAWTAALFLLDEQDDHWWWLQLIRPTAYMDMPWADCDDGGVAESPKHSDGWKSSREYELADDFMRQSSGSSQAWGTAVGDTGPTIHDIDLDDLSLSDHEFAGHELQVDLHADAEVNAVNSIPRGRPDSAPLFHSSRSDFITDRMGTPEKQQRLQRPKTTDLSTEY